MAVTLCSILFQCILFQSCSTICSTNARRILSPSSRFLMPDGKGYGEADLSPRVMLNAHGRRLHALRHCERSKSTLTNRWWMHDQPSQLKFNLEIPFLLCYSSLALKHY